MAMSPVRVLASVNQTDERNENREIQRNPMLREMRGVQSNSTIPKMSTMTDIVRLTRD
jgi:hypothetical protein